jgi:hypothetical protein
VIGGGRDRGDEDLAALPTLERALVADGVHALEHLTGAEQLVDAPRHRLDLDAGALRDLFAGAADEARGLHFLEDLRELLRDGAGDLVARAAADVAAMGRRRIRRVARVGP